MKPVVHFLSQESVEEDLLGGHAPVAATLAGIVTSDAPTKAVALLGEYGSGKSSIIRMAVKRLRARQASGEIEYAEVLFDAWGHQEEALQRAVLLKAVDEVQPKIKDAAEKVHWGEEQKALRSSKTQVVEHSTIRPTFWGWLVSALVVFATLVFTALQAAGPTWSFDVRGWTLSSAQTGAIVAIALAAPVVASCVALIVHFASGLAGKKVRFFLHNSRIETHITEVANDETSLAFESKLEALIQAFLKGRPPGKTFVLFVFDNLDRLPGHRRQSGWSVVELVLSVAKSHGNAVAVVVPYSHSTTGDGLESNDAKQLRKLVGIELFVPPIEVTSWLSYAQEQGQTALPHADKDGVRAAAQVFLSAGQDEQGHPTPRELLGLFNALAAYYLRWGDDIPLPVMALYVVNRQASQVTGETILAAPEKFAGWKLIDHDCREELAMLHFGVPRDKATSLLVQPRLERAMREGKAVNIEELQGLGRLAEMLQTAVTSALVRGADSESPLNAASLAAAIEKAGTPVSTLTARHIADCLQTSLKLPALRQEDLAGIHWLRTKLPVRHLAIMAALNKLQQAGLAHMEGGQHRNSAPKAVDGVRSWLALVRESPEFVPESIGLHGQPEWLTLLTTSFASNPDFARLFHFSATGQDSWVPIERGLTTKTLALEAVEFYRPALKPPMPPPVSNAVLNTIVDTGSSQTLVAAAAASSIYGEQPFINPANQKSMSGPFNHHLQVAMKSADQRGTWFLLANLALGMPDWANSRLSASPVLVEAKKVQPSAEDVAFVAHRLKPAQVAALLATAISSPSRDFAARLLSQLDRVQVDAFGPVEQEVLLNAGPRAAEMLGGDGFEHVLSRTPIARIDAYLERVPLNNAAGWLIPALVKQGGLEGALKFPEAWRKKLAALPRDQVQAILKQEAGLLSDIALLNGAGIQVELPASFAEEYVTLLGSGSRLRSWLGIPSTMQATILRNCHKLLMGQPASSLALLHALDEKQLHQVWLMGDVQELLQRLLPVVIQAKDAAAAAKIADSLKRWSGAELREFADAEIEGALVNAANVATPDMRLALEAIASPLRIKLPRVQGEDAETS